MIKVLICGPFPSPAGGISIHADRLNSLLLINNTLTSKCDESSQKKEHIFNIRSFNALKYLLLIKESDMVHVHSSVDLFRVIHVLCSLLLRKKLIITIHSWRKGPVASKIWSAILNNTCDKIVFVSQEIQKKFNTQKQKSFVFPAFIPPQAPPEIIPPNILSFISKSRSINKKILVSNAFRVVEHDGHDLYGFDLCIEAFSNAEIRKKTALIYVISDPEINKEKIKHYMDSILKQKLSDSVFLHLGTIDFYSLVELADASIRATNTDGDALSVRESIYLKVPCIASDCVIRPSEAIIFKSRSASSLAEKILSTLEQEQSPRNAIFDELHRISDFYKELYQGI